MGTSFLRHLGQRLRTKVRHAFEDAIDGIRGNPYWLSLEQGDGCFTVTTHRGERVVPFSRIRERDPILNWLGEQFAEQDSALFVPPERLPHALKALKNLDEQTVFPAEVPESLASLRRARLPKGLLVKYVWSSEGKCIVPEFAYGGRYLGKGWFASEKYYWQVEGVSAEDEAWLHRAGFKGQEILALVSRVAPSWKKRGLPFSVELTRSSTVVLDFNVQHVTPDAVTVAVSWRANPDLVEDVPGLDGYVVVRDTLAAGIAPGSVPKQLRQPRGTYSIRGQAIVVFLHKLWPKLRPFARGQIAELEKQHRVIRDKPELILTVHREAPRGVGQVRAVATLACGGYRFDAESVSRAIKADTKYLRVTGGWLPADSLRSAGLAGMGRLSDGSSLKPIALSGEETLTRGSSRLDGPWSRIDFPEMRLPRMTSRVETAARHLEFLAAWGVPGGIISEVNDVLPALKALLRALGPQGAGGEVLVLGKRNALDAVEPAIEGVAHARFNGTKKDPALPARSEGAFLATPRALDTVSGLGRREWTLLLLLEADDLVKSQTSKLFDNLVRSKRRLTVGVFRSREFLERRAKREALSAVFKVSSDSPVWECALREPDFEAPSLPAPYRLRQRKLPAAAQGPVQIELQGDATSRGVPIPSHRPMSAAAASASAQKAVLDDVEISIDFGVTTPAHKFMKDARQFVGKTVSSAHQVSFMCYWPTYDSMSPAQLNWYFYWRSQVRRGVYPDTDLSYIFVHVYELINKVGVQDARDGFDQLCRLWRAYRERHPKLDNYLPDWTADYVMVNRLPIDPLQVCMTDVAAGDPDVAMARWVGKPLEKFPLALIDNLTDYHIRKGKFYREGNAEIVEEYVPKCLGQVDGHVKRTTGTRIFDLFRPSEPNAIRRYPFQSAIYAGPEREIKLGTVVPYSSHPPLREFLTAIVKHTENRLRELKGFRGKLRGYVLEAEIESIIDRFISGAATHIAPPPPPPKVEIDIGRVKDLAADSQEIRKRLLEQGEEAGPSPPSRRPVESSMLQPSASLQIKRPAETPEGLLTELEEVHQILAQLSAEEKRIVATLASSGWEMEEAAVAQVLPEVFVEPLIDHINTLSLDALGDHLIVTEGSLRVVTEDYRDELEYLLTRREKTKRETSRPQLPADFPEEWSDFVSQLDDGQFRVLQLIARQESPTAAITKIASDRAAMPELLIDAINELAQRTIGDFVIKPGSTAPALVEESAPMVERLVNVAE